MDSLEIHILTGAQLDSCGCFVDYLIYYSMSVSEQHLHVIQAESVNQDFELFYCTLLQAGDLLCGHTCLILFLLTD